MAGHRYWRVSDVMLIGTDVWTGLITAREMRFVTKSGKLSNNPALAASASSYDAYQTAGKLFDNDVNTLYFPAEGQFTNQWVSYDFQTQEEVIALTADFRRESYAGVWRFISAKIEHSDDNAVWTLAGYANIENGISDYLFSGSISALPTRDLITPIDFDGNTAHLNIYTTDESGSFSGLVTQGKSGEPKLPLKAEVLLYDRATNSLLQRTWSSDIGVYSFSGLDAGREYYAVTLHPSRTYNAAIQDGLKSGMTT